jgi:hypothetical protein
LALAAKKIYSQNESMDLSKVLAQLRAELQNLDAAILSLERLQHEGRRRGRPPKASRPSDAGHAEAPNGEED